MNKILLLLIIINIIMTNNVSNEYNYTSVHDNNYVSRYLREEKILTIALDKTINEIDNNTSITLLYRIKDLVEKLDSKTISKLIHNIQNMSIDYKGYRSKPGNREEAKYYNRKEIINTQSLISRNISETYYTPHKNTTLGPKEGIVDPVLVVVNVVSIASFVIGLYVFRIIKKRTDYI